MVADTQDRTFHIRNSEKCFRFKAEAFCNHAPTNKGIYELVTFDENQNPLVLYVGAAFDEGILAKLEAHAAGTIEPKSADIFAQHPNLYFDYITTWDAKSLEDAQDVYWWLVQKHKPRYNNAAAVQHSGRPGRIDVIED
jgi:hypothetical protein